MKSIINLRMKFRPIQHYFTALRSGFHKNGRKLSALGIHSKVFLSGVLMINDDERPERGVY